MKKVLLVLGFAGLVGIGSASAQLAWGVRAGLDMSTITYEVDGETGDAMDGAVGFSLGPTAYYAFTEHVFLNTGAFISLKRFGEDGETWSYSEKLIYLDIPVYFGYVLPVGNLSLYGQAGPFIGFKLSAKFEETSSYSGTTETRSGNDDDLKGINAGLGFAAGINIQKFKIEVGYQAGLTNIYKDSEGTLKLGSLFLGVSYVF